MTTEPSDDFTDEELEALAQPVIRRLLADPPTVRSRAHDDLVDALSYVMDKVIWHTLSRPSFASRDFGVISVNTVA